MYLKDFFSHYLDDEDLDHFALWAFGENFRKFNNGMKFLEHWNDLHGHQLTLDPAGDVCKDAKFMVKLWKNEK